MTAQDIARIAITVSITQAICDIIARFQVYRKEPYQRSLGAYKRAVDKRDKLKAASSTVAQEKPVESSAATNTTKKSRKKNQETSSDKHAKKLLRAEEDVQEASADVAKRHVTPSFFCSVISLILFRILSAEYSGQVIALLPFTPHWLIQKITARGLPTSEPTNAVSFAFVYLLCTMSCKFMTSQLIAFPPPAGTGGMSNILDSPKSQRFLKSMGVDTDELNEIRQSVGAI